MCGEKPTFASEKDDENPHIVREAGPAVGG